MRIAVAAVVAASIVAAPAAGVNVDVAPVADVPGPGSFMAVDRAPSPPMRASSRRDAAALTRGWELERASLFAAQAGVDLLLVTGSETASARVFRRLLRAAADGSLPRRNLERSHRRVLVLRAALG